MNKVLWFLLIISVAKGQQAPLPAQYQPFRQLIKHYKTYFSGSLSVLDQVKPPLIHDTDEYTTNEFRVMLSDSALALHKEELVIRVPYKNNPYPVSYSVIYENRLVSLFEPGQFACLSIDKLKRDINYEKKLNTKQFDYHWLLGGQLVALSKGIYYWFDTKAGWRLYAEPVPFGKQPKFYEDDRYVAYSTCRGEFGGTLYFHDKQTRLTHFSPYVCARSVIRQSDGYYVLASLGHGVGSADLSLIKNPSELPILKRVNKYDTPEADSTQLADVVKPTVLFDKLAVEFFAGFMFNSRLTYVVSWFGRTFLAEVFDDTIFIKDPLGNNNMDTHEPVTTSYGPNLTLINLGFYMVGGEREISCLLFKRNQLVKIDWNLRNKPIE